MDQIRQNKLSPYTWAALAPILGGDQVVFLNSAFANGMGDVNPSEMRKMHIAASNQNFITAPFGELSTDQIAQQLAWIEQLLGATSDPFALQALQQARERLSHRAPQVATTGGKNG